MKRLVWAASLGIVLLGVSRESQAALTLTPSLSVAEYYTDNLFFLQYAKVGDFSTSVSPGLALAYEGRSMAFDVSYRGTQEYHQRSEENRYSESAAAHASFPWMESVATGLTLDLTAGLSRGAELPAFSYDEALREGNEGIQLPRVEAVRKRAGAVLGYQWSLHTTGTVGYQFSSTHFEAFDLARLADIVDVTPGLEVQMQDSSVRDVSASIRHRWSELLTLTLSPGRSVTTFKSPPEALFELPPDDRVTTRIAGGAEYRMSPTRTVTGSVGVMAIEDDRLRLTMDLGAVETLRDGRLTVRYRRGAGTGGGVTRNVTLTQRLTARLVRDLGPHASWNAIAGYSRTVSIPERTTDRLVRVSTYEVGVGLDWSLLSWLSASLSYSYLTQRTQGVSIEAERNLVAVSLTAAAPWRVIR